ncbi:D-alanine:D-lactate ligase-like protein [Pseudaminobacter sp. 19-2017]|uniref:D-alanine:D-lactate ligase-like protein n=1 Tax=Pseudaminobacter soli (ex Zhang et al. 2022) TaxID=2831468 RepID=A0A942DXT4_9HYPH|nr:D-alanine:D-lactate ligase-like protein [Pseudaminobacter soli]MBS3649027.1 D-alanine:D-lactate ligase-like protein [Pseudaminobacter soli]
MASPRLYFIFEPEEACRTLLLQDGFREEHALEISSYLAQSTDLAPELAEIADACRRRGIDFRPTPLDAAAADLADADPRTSMAWTISDGIAYFRGSGGPALARLRGMQTIGSDDSLFALCQDKFRSGAVLGAMGLPVPAAGLARNGRWLVEPPVSRAGYFVKPNRLGAKIGIWPDSRCQNLDVALELSRCVHSAYRDDVVVQPYVQGRNVRASFLAVDPKAGVDALGVFFVDSGGDFQTMADSIALYGDTGAATKASGAYREPELVPVAAVQPVADRRIREIAAVLIDVLGVKDVFSMDLRVEEDDTVHLIEFEVCPGLPCFDFRAYCQAQWGLSLADSIAGTAARRLPPR